MRKQFISHRKELVMKNTTHPKRVNLDASARKCNATNFIVIIKKKRKTKTDFIFNAYRRGGGIKTATKS